MISVDGVKNVFSKCQSYLLIRNVRKKKMQSCGEYSCAPKTTAIVQFFNKRRNLTKIIPRITRFFDETIVIDDGSIDGSSKLLSKLLTGKNDFYIRSNDLFEVVMYDRAINFSKGEIICLLQDDDIPPDNDSWLVDALKLFTKYPEMQILGGKNGLDILPHDWPAHPGSSETGVGIKTIQHGDVNHYRFYHKPVYYDAGLGGPFMFSVAVNRAPMFIRKSAFLASGGIDQSFRPFQCDDVDSCLRAWEGGWQVGLYNAPFNRNIGEGGMRLYNSEVMGVQAQKNWAQIYQKYMLSINSRQVSEKVRVLNESLLVARKVATS
jgi:glycosyltransferase involved in cell wall biosynthesis